MRRLYILLSVLLAACFAPNVEAAPETDRTTELAKLEKLLDDAETTMIRGIFSGDTSSGTQKKLDARLRAMCDQARIVRELYGDFAVEDDPIEAAQKIDGGIRKLRERWLDMESLLKHQYKFLNGKKHRAPVNIHDLTKNLGNHKIRATKSSLFSVKTSAEHCRRERNQYFRFLEELQRKNLKAAQKIHDVKLRGDAEQIVMNLILLRKRLWNLKCAE